MPFCTACGTQNPDEARFCAQCGTRLVTPASPGGAEPVEEATATIQIGQIGQSDRSDQSSQSSQGSRAGSGVGAGDSRVETSDRQLNPIDAAAVDALPSGHALLVVQRGPGSGSRFLLDADVIHAGRHPESEIFLDDVTVSRRHAQFDRDGAAFTVSDVGSLNGTYVNRDRIDKVLLSDGDEVQIGKYRLVFFAGHPAHQVG